LLSSFITFIAIYIINKNLWAQASQLHISTF
jgi:hypothetical protein